jgi:hypothetical protein
MSDNNDKNYIKIKDLIEKINENHFSNNNVNNENIIYLYNYYLKKKKTGKDLEKLEKIKSILEKNENKEIIKKFLQEDFKKIINSIRLSIKNQNNNNLLSKINLLHLQRNILSKNIFYDDIIGNNELLNIFREKRESGPNYERVIGEYIYINLDKIEDMDLNEFIGSVYFYVRSENITNEEIEGKFKDNKKKIEEYIINNFKEILYNDMQKYIFKDLFTKEEIFDILTNEKIIKFIEHFENKKKLNNLYNTDDSYYKLLIELILNNEELYEKYINKYNKSSIKKHLSSLYYEDKDIKRKYPNFYQKILELDKTILYPFYPELEIEEIEELKKLNKNNKNRNIRLFIYYLQGKKNIKDEINFKDIIDIYENNIIFYLFSLREREEEIKELICKYKPEIKNINKFGQNIKFIDCLFNNKHRIFLEKVYGEEYKSIELTEYEKNIIKRKDEKKKLFNNSN